LAAAAPASREVAFSNSFEGVEVGSHPKCESFRQMSERAGEPLKGRADGRDPNAESPEVLYFESNTLDVDGRCLRDSNGQEVPLTRSEFSLLLAFARNPGRVLSRDQLLNAVAGRGSEPYDRSIDVLVGRLRRKIEVNPKEPRLIVTVPGVGYKFAAKTQPSKPRAGIVSAPPPIRQSTEQSEMSKSAALEEGVAETVPKWLVHGGQFGARQFAYLAATIVAIAIIAGGLWLTPDGRPARVTPPRLSIVVLPFVNLSGDPAQDYLADVITDELTTSLSRLRDAFVISRSTAFSYRGKAVNTREIGKELGVRYVLEGSEYHSGNRVRVNAQLIDAETGSHIWADRFDAERTDLLHMQDEIVTRIARALQMELVAVDAMRIARARVADPTAEDLAMRCEAASFYGGSNVLESATHETGYAFCESALRIDPRNVRALSNLAFKYAARVAGGESTNREADLQRANELVSQALAIDPKYYHALFVKALVLEREGHPEGAVFSAERCLASNPSFVICIFAIGRGNVFLGRPERAIEYIDRAIRLSPHDSFLNLFCQFRAEALWMLGRDDEAIEWWRRSLAINAEFPLVQLRLAAALAANGRTAEARNELLRYLALKRAQARTIAELKQAYPVVSKNPRWIAHRERLFDGVRKAGMAEE
jgi:TolB-like protein/DNA-binding winged helix-turn-helix (wHTH) protein/tetratricopeptide (TPR) repeat protein